MSASSPPRAVASRVVQAPASRCYAALTQAPWGHWMPASFRPGRVPGRAIAVGDRIAIRIGLRRPPVAVRTRITMLTVEPDRQVSWRGGVPGLLEGEHAFRLEPDGEGRTRVVSEEVFRGVLCAVGPLARVFVREAQRAGEEQLEALARFVE